MSNTTKDKRDDSGLSHNHNKNIRFRKRVQQEKEAEEEMKQLELFDDEEDSVDMTPYWREQLL